MNSRRTLPTSLALAVVDASNMPLLLLDVDLTVIAASASFCAQFQIDPKSAPGRPLAQLGAGEWNIRQLASLLNATASGSAEIEAYGMDLVREGRETRRLRVNARKLEYGGADELRLLLTVCDMTEARRSEKLKDDLLREKAILLQELQHRVANSLQIIASVLMQNARNVDSGETRQHLYAAHNRVLSVAAIQDHLVPTRLGDIDLRCYLTDLCQSIGASMIRDPDQLSLDVEADGGLAAADICVSLGLIVTELVINALKHAFPGRRSGRILVRYRVRGSEWTLSVAHDGVGIPRGAFKGKPGLGTGIVEAIAKQLGATMVVGDANPGTAVSIAHAEAVIGLEDRPVAA
jgi:two-component system, sensor histidine kinase PdtaS